MTDYSKLSDREIDRLVLNIVYGRHANDKDVQRCWSRGGFKYTNNPDEAWSIIVANKISIVSLDNKWIAAPVDAVIDGITGDSEVCFYASSDVVSDANPLRAAMIVFLQMQENNHD